VVSAGRRQIFGGGVPTIKNLRRRPGIVGGGAAAGAQLYFKMLLIKLYPKSPVS